jgi:hypothetical protein
MTNLPRRYARRQSTWHPPRRTKPRRLRGAGDLGETCAFSLVLNAPLSLFGNSKTVSPTMFIYVAAWDNSVPV